MDMAHADPTAAPPVLSAQELLAGSRLVHELSIPPAVLAPGGGAGGAGGKVRLRPLSLATMTLISRAARDDASLVPVLMVKEALVEPPLGLEQIRQMHIGLVDYLVGRINVISGLEATGEALQEALDSPFGQTHLLLARHFGWTPEQVGQLTPGQVALYLAGVEKFLALAGANPEVKA